MTEQEEVERLLRCRSRKLWPSDNWRIAAKLMRSPQITQTEHEALRQRFGANPNATWTAKVLKRSMWALAAIALALAAIVAALLISHDKRSDKGNERSTTDSPSVHAQKPPSAIAIPAPSWVLIAPGTQAYTRAKFIEVDQSAQSITACPTVTDFTDYAQSNKNDCKEKPVGQLVTIHKIHQDPRPFGGDAIYVIAATWSGLVADTDIVPVVPQDTIIRCDYSEGSRWELLSNQYTDAEDLGHGAFRARVLHALQPDETFGPALEILSGRGTGKHGYLTFENLRKCKIDGTPYAPDFNASSYERKEAPYDSKDGA